MAVKETKFHDDDADGVGIENQNSDGVSSGGGGSYYKDDLQKIQK